MTVTCRFSPLKCLLLVVHVPKAVLFCEINLPSPPTNVMSQQDKNGSVEVEAQTECEYGSAECRDDELNRLQAARTCTIPAETHKNAVVN